MTSKGQGRDRKNFEASYWLPIGNRIFVEVHGHVSDDVTCRKLWQFKAGGLLGTNNGCKILANEC